MTPPSPLLRLPAAPCWGLFTVTLLMSLLLALMMGAGTMIGLVMRWILKQGGTDPGAMIFTPEMGFLLAMMVMGFALAWCFGVMARRAVGRNYASTGLLIGALYHAVLTWAILAQDTTSAVHIRQAGISLSLPLALFTVAAGALSIHLLWKYRRPVQPPPLPY